MFEQKVVGKIEERKKEERKEREREKSAKSKPGKCFDITTKLWQAFLDDWCGQCMLDTRNIKCSVC